MDAREVTSPQEGAAQKAAREARAGGCAEEVIASRRLQERGDVMYTLAFELAALRRLRDVDCSTSRCFANAYGTGRIMTHRDRHFVEFACPDCGDRMLVGSPDVDGFVRELANATPEEHENIANRWVDPRVGQKHPCRALDQWA
jgi:hypothetical protein